MIYSNKLFKIWWIMLTILVVWFPFKGGIESLLVAENVILGISFIIISLIIFFIGNSENTLRRVRRSIFSNTAFKTKLIIGLFGILIFVLGCVQVFPVIFWPDSIVARGMLFWIVQIDSYLGLFLAISFLSYTIYLITHDNDSGI